MTFDEVYKNYYKFVMKNFLYHNNRQEAEQATQEVFIEVLRQLPHYDPKYKMTSFLVWLIKCHQFKRFEKANREKRQGETIGIGKTIYHEPRSLYAYQDFEVSRDLEVIINSLKLTDIERETLRLAIVEDLSTTEIAAKLGKSRNNISSKYQKALSHLKAKHFAA